MSEQGRFEERPPPFDPPFDQHPVDQQPLPPRLRADATDDGSSGPVAPGIPQLPTESVERPAMPSRPTDSPLIPPLETTSPVDFVDAATDPVVGAPPVAAPSPPQLSSDAHGFEPLRADPPPSLVPTWWLRSAVLVSMLAAVGVTMLTEYHGAPGDVASSTRVWGVHVTAGALLVLWSYLAMGNAGRIVPATRYHKRSSGSLAVVLWLLAAVAPLVVVAVARGLDERLDDPDDVVAVVILVAVVLIAFLFIWMPFSYHARQASRVGAPHRAMIGWFFAPLLAAVGGLLAVSVGLGDLLADDGLQRSERLLRLGVLYGLPMVVFALSTWRAIKVFDEVVDIRWRRWHTEWEQTLASLVAQPVPGPEDSPIIDGRIDS